MFSRLRSRLSRRQSEREEREAQALEAFAGAEDEARGDGPDPHDVAEDRLQHPAQNAPPV